MHLRRGAVSEVCWPSGRQVWFSVSLTADEIANLDPVFQGCPQAHIAAFELLAQLCLLWLVDTPVPGCRSLVAVSLRCDNAGAEAATAKGLSGVRSLALVLQAFTLV